MRICRLQRLAVRASCAAAMVAACAYQAHERQLTIAPDPVPCEDGTAGSCLSVTDADGDSWTTYLDEIEGFTYEPGFTYELLVEDSSEVAEIEDATPPRPRLIRVLSKQKSGESSQVLNADLSGARWVLSAIEPSDQPAADWAASGITAQFDVGSSRVSGFAGCNDYSAALSVSGDQLQVSPPASTRKACASQTANALEQEYLQRIIGATAYSVTDDHLDLSLSDGSGMAFHAEGH